MRVLWITNIPLPPICEDQSMPVPSVGGWMYSSLKRLKDVDGIEVAVATVYPGRDLVQRTLDGVSYYLLPLNGKSMIKYNKRLEELWKMIRDDFRPDVVHIHGTEYPHGLAYIQACGNDGVCVSIQGLLSAYCRYYKIEGSHTKFLTTFRDLIRRGGIKNGQKEFRKRGRFEKTLLTSVKHIIGRTEWDKAHSWAINPKAMYYHVGETLRDSFYNAKWNYSKCRPFSIFVSQASYPIKGLHKLLEALPIVLRHYPNTRVRIAGLDPTSLPFYRITAYGKYLRRLMWEYALVNHVTFTGILSEKQMCEEFLKANVFVLCSAIENSPNSLGEAQLLEMPYIASYVGGVPELVGENTQSLYRFEETEMLAKKICDIFAAGSDVEYNSAALTIYDAERNTSDLIEAYKNVNSYVS